MKITLLGAASALFLMTGTIGGAFAAPVDQPGHESPKPGANNEAMSATEDTVAKLVGAVSAEMTSTTKGFVTAAATSDMYEVTAAKIALQQRLAQGEGIRPDDDGCPYQDHRKAEGHHCRQQDCGDAARPCG